jgi:regulator of sigma E protease
MLSIIVNILLFILVIGLLTFVHELGHFLAAKAIKAGVEEFSLGFGPQLFAKKYKGTLYCIRILPLGGYVKIKGDGDPQIKEKKKKESGLDSGDLRSKPRWQQAIVMLAGITMNILFAVSMYYIVLASSGWHMYLNGSFKDFKPTGAVITRERVEDVTYTSLVEGGNAESAGLPAEGTIKSVNDKEVMYSDDLIPLLKENSGKNVKLNVCTTSNCVVYDVPVSNEGTIGIAYRSNYYIVLSYSDSKITAGFSHMINTLRLVGIQFSNLFIQAKTTGNYSELSTSVSGPIGIYFVIDYFKNLGFVSFIGMMADLSLSLAVMNILPIPALDGGRVLILAIEGILRKDLNDKVKTIIINGSFIFLMLLVILIMIKDVLNIQNIKDMLK